MQKNIFNTLISLRENFKNEIKNKYPSIQRRVKLFKRSRWAHSDAYFNWSRILDEQLQTKNEKKKRVLIATSTGGLVNAVSLEGAIGAALTLRGAEVHVLLCDAALPACQECQIEWYPNQNIFIENGPRNDLCKNCFQPANSMYQSLGFIVHRFSDYITDSDKNKANQISTKTPFLEIRNYQLEGMAIGEHAYAGSLRFFAKGKLKQEKYSEVVLRKYFNASILTTFALIKLLSTYEFQSAFFNHGIYVPQGLIGEVCRAKGVPVVNWNPGYKKKCFIFSHDNTYHHTMMTEPVDNWSSIEWSEKLEHQLMSYLKSRWEGTQDWIWFHHEPQFDLENISKRTGIDFNKPCIGVLTSVMWDAVLHYPSNAFTDMVEWIYHTIEYFIERPELQLIIRVHPAELRGTLPSNQKMCDEINKMSTELPENIFVIPPESDVSTYAVMQQCDSVIIYNTKTGVELSAMGIPVIVAGEAWIRNKGFAIEVVDKLLYYNILDRLPLKKQLDEEKLLLAKKYAYHFFFRRMIPLNIMKPTNGNIPYKVGINTFSELNEGADLGLDIVCDGILNGREFIFPAENTNSQV